MRTITQLQQDIKDLLDKAKSIETRAENENRDLNDEEIDFMNKLTSRIKEVRLELAARQERERLEEELSKPNEPLTVIKDKKMEIKRKKDMFCSLGEQLVASIEASRPGGKIDPRLFGAATGMSESVSSDGGFLVQQDFTNELLQDTLATGLLASRCRRIPISATSNSVTINGVDETSRASTRYGGILGYWIDEAAEKNKSKPKFRQIELKLKKLIGLCYATDELLQDASALESFIRTAFAGEFGFLIDDAIINGTGANQPLGILNSGCLVSVGAETGQASATVVTENIVKMWSRRLGPDTNYAWFYNRNIEPQLFTMSLAVGTGGSAVYMPPGGLSQAPYGSLMGRPAIAIEQAATLGTQGDIILANFQDGYILAEKGGIAADMSIHVRFVYDESVFRFVMRLDGQPVRASALTPYKGGAGSTQSHFIVLDTR